jgi:peroxiredoxin
MALQEIGGGILAISVDSPEKSRKVVEKQKLGFPILADVERKVTQAYGVVHAGGSRGGEDIPLPSHFLIDKDGRIAWSVVAHHPKDRPRPDQVIEQIRSLSP